MYAMIKQTICVGDKIELEHLKSATGRKLSDRKYGSKLLDYDGIRTAKIAMPLYEGKIIPLETGDEYTICFFTSAGLYQCIGQIKSRSVDQNVFVLVVEFITMPKKFQRRGFYRLDCLFPIRHRGISEAERILAEQLLRNEFGSSAERKQCEDELKRIAPEWKEAMVSDISGGGIRFHGNEERAKDEIIEIFLPLSIREEIVPVKVKMRVISCTHSRGTKVAYEVRGEFIDLEETTRELIIKYVFEEQRKRLRKD